VNPMRLYWELSWWWQHFRLFCAFVFISWFMCYVGLLPDTDMFLVCNILFIYRHRIKNCEIADVKSFIFYC
jgi:hypothetical protein